VFVKGGSILPILLHDDCMALSQCYWGKIRLEVYLDWSKRASGFLFTDDGVSVDAEHALVDFSFHGESLTSKRREG